ncbi:MAG: hypothetical protein WD963_00345 [Candidatus Paceibacterota bacterium]
MMRFIMPVILIGIGLAVFFLFTNPLYNDITQMRLQTASYNEALNNSKALENERDKLTAKLNSFNRDDLAKLQKLLPDNVDNIRLILEIEQLALPYGMVLKDVKYSATAEEDSTSGAPLAGAVVRGGGAATLLHRDYDVWDLEFSTTGTYNNFLNFTRDLESNLRIVDISSIEFSSNTTPTPTTGSTLPGSYTYDFKIKTYWLKN